MRLGSAAVVVVVVAVSNVAAQGQTPLSPSDPVVTAVTEVHQRLSAQLVTAAELMPADKYGYHPTPAQMTFGQLMAHVAQTNVVICSTFTETPSPFDLDRLREIAAFVDKDALLPVLKQSFEYCGAALRGASDGTLGRDALLFGRSTGKSQASALVTIATDWTDHYSTAAGYLRLNALLPPSAQAAAR